jgi:hypothetical protein
MFAVLLRPCMCEAVTVGRGGYVGRGRGLHTSAVSLCPRAVLETGVPYYTPTFVTTVGVFA